MIVSDRENTNEIVENLAKQWLVTNDSKVWTFTLRNDVFFHDGSKLDSNIVKFSILSYFQYTPILYRTKLFLFP